MDLAGFAEDVRSAVQGTCGDVVVESHEQAAGVIDVLLRRPGRSQRDVAAAFGLTLEQLARSIEFRESGGNVAEHELYAELCRADAVYTWNVLIERVNQAAHWSEEFRDLQREAEGPEAGGSEDESDVVLDDGASCAAASDLDVGGAGASGAVRAQARRLFAKHLEAATEPLRTRLAERLEEEAYEQFPDGKDYRCHVRSIAANLRRNVRLAASYASGFVPPQWLARAGHEALASKTGQLQRQVLRCESLREAKCDDETAKIRSRANIAGKATELAAPPPLEDPLN
eukprot:TRINITY_DN52178_c0_g1_i1.p2 TRINITY_DN52178_c0_g1~~TRINITY_DN52178_c0_g1_i1.p2  ORF type:complete len:307 (+),score=89.43 TRINITY_DN52178_c0_g1_i1:66-923(+)